MLFIAPSDICNTYLWKSSQDNSVWRDAIPHFLLYQGFNWKSNLEKKKSSDKSAIK